MTRTSSPGERIVRSATFRAPAAPQVMITSSSVNGIPVEAAIDFATSRRTSGYPAFGM